MSRQLTLAFALLLSLSLCLAGCAGGTGVANAGTSGTGGNGSNPGSLAAGSSSLNFGSVSMGSAKAENLTLTNTSTNSQSVTVSNLSVSGTGFSLATSPSLPFTLNAGESATISLNFSPTTAAADSGSLVVTNNSASATLKVGLTGDGTALGGLNVSPTTLAFGNVPVGTTATLAGTLSASNTSVTINSADWSGAGFAMSGISFPLTIAAGQSVPFTVTFDPTTAGNAAGDVSFVSNATNSPTAQAFSGDGTQSSQPFVALAWDASSSPVSGYNVYRGGTSGGPYSTKLTASLDPATSFTDTTVQSGSTYYYVSTAVDSSGRESVYSNPAMAVVP